LLNSFKHNQGRNEVRRRPRQEASLVPPCSSLRSFGRKFTVLKKVLVKLLGFFGNPTDIWQPPQWFGARRIAPTLPPRRYDPGHNCQALTSLRNQGRRRVYWEGPKCFWLCPTHFSREGKFFFSAETEPPAPFLVTGLIIGNDFLFFISLHCPQLSSDPPALPTFQRPWLDGNAICKARMLWRKTRVTSTRKSLKITGARTEPYLTPVFT